MKVLSLFSGVGGFDMGLENTHRELKIWQSAVDRLRTHIQQGIEL